MDQSKLSTFKLHFEQSEDDLALVRQAVKRARQRVQAKLRRKEK